VRGDLYRLRSDKDTTGHEQRGPRYAVAIQSDGILLSTLIVAPTSTSARPAIFRPDVARRLDAAEAAEVDRAVRLILGVL
jgi:mRNA interferase MazF